MKEYFKYQLKKQLLPLAVLVISTLVVYVFPALMDNYGSWNNPQTDYVYLNLHVSNILVALGMMCVVMPIYMLSYKMTKRSADLYYALPLSRTKIFAVHFLVGFLYLICAYTIGYWLGFVIIAVKVKRLFLIYYLWIYLASLVPAFIVYAITAFAFTRANTVSDGIIFVTLLHFVPVLIMSTAETLLWRFGITSYINSTSYFFFAPLDSAGRLISAISYGPEKVSVWTFTFSDITANLAARSVNDLIGCLFAFIAACAATAGMFLTEKECKAENCGQISESIFGYKTLIPLFTVCLMVSLTEYFTESIALIILAFCAFIATIIYRRTIKIGKRQAIIFAIYVAAGVILTFATLAIGNIIDLLQPAYAFVWAG